MWGSGSVGLHFVMQTRPLLFSLVCGSCSSGRDFALGFLKIPPHVGHHCLQLVVPTAKPTADFHRQVNTHAGRTNKKNWEIIYPNFLRSKRVSKVSTLAIFLFVKAVADSKNPYKIMVGARGFEPPTPWSQTKCAAKLRYAPT